jgi:hypothetical protein
VTARATKRASSLKCLSISATHTIPNLHVTGALAQSDNVVVYAVPRVKDSEVGKGLDVPTVICIVIIQVFHFHVIRCCQQLRVLQDNAKLITYPVFRPQSACYEEFVKADARRGKYSHGRQETLFLGFSHSPDDNCSIVENENFSLRWNSVKFADLLAFCGNSILFCFRDRRM